MNNWKLGYIPHLRKVQIRREVSGRFTATIVSSLDQSVAERRSGFATRLAATGWAREKRQELKG